jgi:hypothetical protein
MFFLEITIFLPVFHCRFRHLIIDAGFAAFACFGGGNFADDIVDIACLRFNGSRTGHIAHGAVTHFFGNHSIGIIETYVLRNCYQLPFVLYNFTLMRKVDGMQRYLFAADIVPYIQLGPVADGKCANVAAFMNFAIVYVP